MQKPAGEALAAGAAAEDDDVAAEEPGAGRELDPRLAAQTRAVEQDRLGRQEFERSRRRRPQALAAITVVAPVER